MTMFRVAATFDEERSVEAETAEEAELLGRNHYAENPAALAGLLRVTAFDCSDGAGAYRRLLDRARCGPDHAMWPAFRLLPLDVRVGHVAAQLRLLGVRGFTREYVARLVRENFGGQK